MHKFRCARPDEMVKVAVTDVVEYGVAGQAYLPSLSRWKGDMNGTQCNPDAGDVCGDAGAPGGDRSPRPCPNRAVPGTRAALRSCGLSQGQGGVPLLDEPGGPRRGR